MNTPDFESYEEHFEEDGSPTRVTQASRLQISIDELEVMIADDYRSGDIRKTGDLIAAQQMIIRTKRRVLGRAS